MDVIPVELTEEFIELLTRGVRVFSLRRLTLLARKRQELGLSKNSRNDIRAMMALEERWFAEAREDYLVMRRLIAVFRSLRKSHMSLISRMKALDRSDRDILKASIDFLEKQAALMASRITEEASKRIPGFDKAVANLGITGENHLFSREALAEVLLPFAGSRSFRRLRKFFGLFPAKRGVNKFYSKDSRHALSRLATAVLANTRHSAKDEQMLLKKLWETVREPRERLETPA